MLQRLRPPFPALEHVRSALPSLAVGATFSLGLAAFGWRRLRRRRWRPPALHRHAAIPMTFLPMASAPAPRPAPPAELSGSPAADAAPARAPVLPSITDEELIADETPPWHSRLAAHHATIFRSDNPLAGLPLSARERDILRQVARGLSNLEVGEQLGIVELTMKRHMSNILSKLEAHDRSSAVEAARERGLI